MGYLSETTRRRIAAVILVVGVVLAVLAITDSAFFEDPPTEEEVVEGAVREFFAATSEGDFKHSCELLAQEAQETMRVAVARVTDSDVTELRCTEIMKEALGDAFAGIAVKVRSVNIEGNKARAETALKAEGEPSEFQTVELVTDDGGDWQIYRLP